MKLIIAGGRNLKGDHVNNILYEYFTVCHGDNYVFDPTDISEVVCGEATGIDAQGKQWAEEEFWWDSGHVYKNKIPVKSFPADWDKHGRAAGPIRNRKMAEYADALLLIWDGKSRGSANMKKEMEKLNKPVYEVKV